MVGQRLFGGQLTSSAWNALGAANTFAVSKNQMLINTHKGKDVGVECEGTAVVSRFGCWGPDLLTLVLRRPLGDCDAETLPWSAKRLLARRVCCGASRARFRA